MSAKSIGEMRGFEWHMNGCKHDHTSYRRTLNDLLISFYFDSIIDRINFVVQFDEGWTIGTNKALALRLSGG